MKTSPMHYNYEKKKNTTGSSNEIETRILNIWKTVLGDKEISTDEDFYSVGGTLFSITGLITEMFSEFNIRMSVNELLNNLTVQKQAVLVKDKIVDLHLSQLFNASAELTAKDLNPIKKVGKKEFYKASSAQRRLYFLYELEKSSVAYNLPSVISIKGPLDTRKLDVVFNKLLELHEGLRTSFAVIEDEVVQKIDDEVKAAVSYFESDTSSISVSISEFIRPFDLSKAPLIRIGLIKTAPDDHVLVLDIHHIVTDGISQGILIKDFSALYCDKDLPELRLQYKDYAEWQQGDKQQEHIAAQLEFWKQEFSDVSVLELPTDFPRPLFKGYTGGNRSFSLNKEETKQLKAIGEQGGATMFMTVLSVFNVLLSKLSNQVDISIGTPVADRGHKEMEGVIGMFVNTVVLRNYPEGELSFRKFLSQVKRKALSCFENQSYQYEELIRKLNITRDTSRNPLFDVMLIFQNIDIEESIIPDLKLKSNGDKGHNASQFDLTLMAGEVDGELHLNFQYSTDLFAMETIDRFIFYFQRIVAEVIQGADKKLSEIDILLDQEREFLHTLNDTAVEYRLDETLIDLFEAQVKKTPEKLALIFEGIEINYRTLNCRVNQLASHLRDTYHIRPNDFVAIMVERSEFLVIGLMAILKSGGAYVPIDPAYPQSRKEFILKNSNAKLLLTQQKYKADINYIGNIELLPFDFPKSNCNSENLPIINDVSDLCYIIYTSGSTGWPKGVMVTHRNVNNFFLGMDQYFSLTENDKMLATTSISFDISVLELLWPLCRGIQVEVHSADIGLNGFDRYAAEEKSVMDFSLFFFANYNTDDLSNKYDLLLKSSVFADQAGFKSVWTPERHFHEFGGLYPNPSVLSSALAMLTQQIQLRSGSVVLPLHKSIDIANDWSAVDNLSGGRVGLAFASGWNPNDFVLSNSDFQHRRESTFIGVETLQKIWKGEMLSIGDEGEMVQISQKPVQKELPIWITAAGSDDTFKQAGSMGTNLLTHLLGQDTEELSRKIQLYRNARKEAGHSGPGHVSLMVHTFIGARIDEVEAIVEKPFIEYLRSNLGLNKIVSKDIGIVDDEELSPEQEERLLKNAFKRYYKTSSLIGTISSVKGLVRNLNEIGINEICCLIDFGVDKQLVLESLNYLKDLKEMFSSENSKKSRLPVSIMQSTPSFLKILESDLQSQKFLKSLRYLLVGGENLPLSLLKRLWLSCDGNIYNMYGPTETTIWSCVKKFTGYEQVTVGNPIANTQAYILDRDFSICPIGVSGNLYIGGEGVSKGYWKNQELTRQKFIENPFKEGGLIYNTGDLAMWLPGGELKLIGRKDDQVKIRGFRIELGEIESHLQELNRIKEAVVIAKGNEGEQHLVAYYVADHKVDLTELRNFLLEKLPEYMIPSFFVLIDEVPLTSNGKVDKKRLPEPVVERQKYIKTPETKEELLLAKIWSNVLRLKEISVTDDFFSLGGDSIKSIQISARAREAGYDLKVKDIFISQNIEQLALKIRNIHGQCDQRPVVGKGMFTPIQQWFYNYVTVNKAHYNQSVVLHFSNRINKNIVFQIFGKILEHHDSLRLVFREEAGGVVSEYKAIGQALSLTEIDFTGVADFKDQLVAHANGIQSGIDLQNGPLINLGLFHQDEGSRLLIVIHHLVVDGISWRILFEDIERLYTQVINQEALKLPLKTESYQAWAAQLIAYVSTLEFKSAKEYWNGIIAQEVGAIKCEHPGVTNKVADQKTERFKLNKEQTAKLLGEVHWSYKTQINDILLTALFMAVQRKYGNKTLNVDLEGHGREPIHDQINIARTIGWFTSIYTIRLEDGKTLAGTIKKTKEIFRKIPNNGIDYLLYKYYDTTAPQELFNKNQAQILFNYLGQFDADTRNRPFSVSMESMGNMVSLEGETHYEWEIVGVVSDDELHMGLTYSEKQYSRVTIADIMSFYKESLTEIIKYCCSQTRQELTPSDLTFKKLPINLLESLQSKYEVEDIYPLSPMQEGLLFHSLHDAESDHYFNQIVYRVSGNLNLEVMKSSIEQLISRYQILRTVYLPNEFDRPLQVVLRKQPLDFVFRDIRSNCTTGNNTEQVVEAYKLEDRKNKFDLVRNLLRVIVLQTGTQQFHVIWSYHHILMDGWCIGILLQEFRDIYKHRINGREIQLGKSEPYSKYIKWLEKRDDAAVMDYWKSRLSNYETLATLPISKTLTTDNQLYKQGYEVLMLEKKEVQLLGELSEKCGVTINNIIQTIWGILLAKYNKVNDVVFGAIVSGRPAEISGIETMVGLFMNMIPVRVTFREEENVVELFKKVQQEFLDSEPFQYHSLADVQSQSPLGRNLFDHFFVFENYPIRDKIHEPVDANDFQIEGVEVFEQTNYDFSITVIPGAIIEIRFNYCINLFDNQVIKELSFRFKNMLKTIIAKPQLAILEINVLDESES